MRKIITLLFLFWASLTIAQTSLPRYELKTVSGTDTYTASISPTPSLQNGLKVAVKFTNANTGAATFNLNSLGAITLRKFDGTALAAGDIAAGSVWWVVYDSGTVQWRLVGGGGGGGHIIEDSGTPLAAQPDLNFTNGLTATNDIPNTATVVKLGGEVITDISLTSANLSGFTFYSTDGIGKEVYFGTDPSSAFFSAIDANAFSGGPSIGTAQIATYNSGVIEFMVKGNETSSTRFVNEISFHNNNVTNTYIKIIPEVDPQGHTGLTQIGIDWNPFYYIGDIANKIAFRGTSGALLLGGLTLTPGNSGIVDLQSTTQGFFPPRMTTAQKNAITTPSEGLMVYDTTLNKLCVYTTVWESIQADGLSWQTSGSTTVTTPTIVGNPYFSGNTLFGNTAETITANTKVDIRGSGTTTNLALRIANSSNVITHTLNDYGQGVWSANINLAGSTAAIYNFSNTAGLWTANMTAGAMMRLNMDYRQNSGTNGNVSGIDINTFLYNGVSNTNNINGFQVSGSSGSLFLANYSAFKSNINLNNSSGSGTQWQVNLVPTYNFTGTYSGFVYGLDYNPTLTSMTGVTHIALRATSGSVLIGGTTLTTNAILDLQSTTRAFIPPRMTTAQKNAITTPSAGMMVYDTTLNKLCVYTTVWETVTSI